MRLDRSSENSVYVVVGLLAGRLVREDHLVIIEFDDFPVPKEHSPSGKPPGLLDQIRDEDDGHLLLQLFEDILNSHGGYRVDGNGEFVQTKYLGLMRERAGN